MPDQQPDQAPPSAPPTAGYLGLFRVREFRAMFAAHVLSLLGTAVATLALPVLVYARTASPLLTAVTFALGFVPNALGGVLLAPVADRFAARRVLVGCDVFSAACVAVMLIPDAPLGLLLALRAATAFVQPLFTGVRAASLGAILAGDAFVLGRSLLRIVAQSAQIAGNAATGLLLVVLAPRQALALTVAGFLGSALLLRIGTRLRPAPGPRTAVRTTAGVRTAARARTAGTRTAGTRALLADRRVRALLLLCWLPPAFAVVPEGLAAPYADGLGGGSVAVGLLLAAGPVGAVVGELVVGTFLPPATRERLVLPLAVALPLPLLAFAVRPGLPLALAALCLSGLAFGYTLGLDRWFFDAVPEEARGRAMTLLSAGLMSAQGLGMALGGALAEFVPPHWAITATGAAGALCGVAVVRAVAGSRRVA